MQKILKSNDTLPLCNYSQNTSLVFAHNLQYLVVLQYYCAVQKVVLVVSFHLVWANSSIHYESHPISSNLSTSISKIGKSNIMRIYLYFSCWIYQAVVVLVYCQRDLNQLIVPKSQVQKVILINSYEINPAIQISVYEQQIYLSAK